MLELLVFIFVVLVYLVTFSIVVLSNIPLVSLEGPIWVGIGSASAGGATIWFLRRMFDWYRTRVEVWGEPIVTLKVTNHERGSVNRCVIRI